MADKNTNNECTCGILSIVMGVVGWIFLGIIFEPAGLILAIYGLNKETNKIPSIIGLVISGVGLIAMIMFMISASAVITRRF